MEEPLQPLLRSRIYKILSICFVYPDDKSFDYMKKEMLADLEECLKRMPNQKALAGTFETFKSALEKEVTNGQLLDLQVEHTSMFIYPRPEIPCPPYESVYVENVRRLMGDSTMDVKRSYNDHRLALSDQFRDLPDRISAELEFMHYLSYNEASAMNSGKNEESTAYREAERSFLVDHVLKRLPKFASCLKDKSASSVLVSASKLASEFAAADAVHLADSVLPNWKGEEKTRNDA